MLSLQAKRSLVAALANQKLADEIEARLISSTPADEAAAQAVLDSLDASVNKKIEEYLIVALASRKAGQELAKKINGAVSVLQAQADGNEVAAVAASFTGQVAGMTTDVTIDADTAGAAGNVTLTGDGVSDIDTLISDWNLANPSNTLTLSAGDGSQIPDNSEDIVLSGGADASDANLGPAKAAMGSDKMSQSTYEILVIAMASKTAAKEFKDAFDAMIDAIQAI